MNIFNSLLKRRDTDTSALKAGRTVSTQNDTCHSSSEISFKNSASVPLNLEDKEAFVFGKDISNKIKAIASEADISESDMLQRALILMEVAVNASKSKDRLVIVDENDKVKTRITGLVGTGA
jgi:hypothetical protein